MPDTQKEREKFTELVELRKAIAEIEKLVIIELPEEIDSINHLKIARWLANNNPGATNVIIDVTRLGQSSAFLLYSGPLEVFWLFEGEYTPDLDLNHINKVCQEKLKNSEQIQKFVLAIDHQLGYADRTFYENYFDFMHATAEQRCQALKEAMQGDKTDEN